MTREKSDLSRAFSEDGARKTHVGGQALLEGIMMRGKYNWSVAVREPSGAVYTEEHDAKREPANHRDGHLLLAELGLGLLRAWGTVSFLVIYDGLGSVALILFRIGVKSRNL